MTQEFEEFIDSISDDLIYLQAIKKMLYTRAVPFRPQPKLYIPFLCRMLAVVSVSAIEHILRQWKRSSKNKILNVYFTRDGNVPNEERVKDMREALVLVGIKMEDDILNDYLAIKYLRNVTVHTGWSANQRKWVEDRNFPSNVLELDERHFSRMLEVTNKLIMQIEAARLNEVL